jgi:hypothetical protein
MYSVRGCGHIMAGIPENAKAIYTFLTGAGFSDNAAAGILGNIEQESGGNPHSPSGGLIQILGQSGGDLKEQLQATMAYIRANGSVKDINAHATSPSAAALYFSTKYERPNAALANNANRTASAELVAKAAKSGNWPKGSASDASGGDNAALGLAGGISAGLNAIPGFGFLGSGVSQVSGVGQTVGDIATSIGAIGNDLSTAIHFVAALFRPALWLRVGAFVVGLLALFAGAFFIGKAMGIQGPKMPPVVPIPV